METLQTPRVSHGAHDETPSTDARDKRKRQPRNSACQACASLKMKCVPSPVSGKCERCNRMDRDCVPSIPKPRKRRSSGEKPDVHSPCVPLPSARDTVPDAGVRLLPANQDQPVKHSLLSQSDLLHTGSRSFAKLLAQNLSIESSAADLLHGIDYNYVQNSFTVYRQLAAYFPFYGLRPDASAISMANDRPMMTAAICTVASSAQPDIQTRLAQAFRLSLAAKVIMQGERSMDLLTGLLVFLSWHHKYMAKQQIHQLTYLLAGMASDLGLDRQPYGHEAADLAAVLERDRAFLGCYYVCSGLSVMGFNKSSPLRWTDNLRRCAENVAMSGAQAQDRLLVGIIELVRAVDDLEDALRTGGETKRSTYPAYVEMHTKATSHRLKALKREHPELGGTLGYAAANIHFYHRLLRASDTPDTATLIQCACAIKEYVDDLLGRPPITLHQVAIVDWTNVLEILLLMAQVSKPLPSPGGWEAGALSSMLQPDTILDALCAHMAAAPNGDPLAPRHEAQLQWFRGVCDNISKRIIHESTSSKSTLQKDEFQFDTVHSFGQKRQPVQGRFRPVNEAYRSELSIPTQGTQYQASGLFNSFNLLDGGVLDEGFWNSLFNS